MKKTIALIAHDNRKSDLLDWVKVNRSILIRHKMVCTGTTGRLVEKALLDDCRDDNDLIDLTKFKSGPLGGDQQLGALVCSGDVDMMIFLWDPISVQPHDVDVKALLRIGVLYNVPIACNRASADFMISSPLLDGHYENSGIDENISQYLHRDLPGLI
ncbi:MAG: methylglyoxal synthase [Candidatus Latescibacterota bacterium]|nr:methylglyoxal synthase [Candidatus Latescibacterota bacterium]